MRITTLVWSSIAVVGLAGALVAGYLIMNGPFLGGQVIGPTRLMVSLAGFIVGLTAFALGGSKLARSRAGY